MGYDSEYILTVVGSFVFHLVVSELLSEPLLRKMAPAFLTLPANKQVILRNSVMSTFHAAITGGYGLYCHSLDGFTAEDLWLILHTLGYKRSLLYKVNGVAMLVVFFIFRIATIPAFFLGILCKRYKHVNTTSLDKMGYDSEYILTVVGSFVFHLAISELLSEPLLRKMAPAFLTLPANKQVILRNSVMSTFHAAITGGYGLYCHSLDGFTAEDLWFEAPTSAYIAGISIGYAIVDILMMAIHVPLRDWKICLHHVVGMVGCYNVIMMPAALYFNPWPLFELSTPFINMRLILHTLGYRRSLLYKVNGVAMLVVFFIFRIATIPAFFLGVIPHLKTGELYKLGTGLLLNILVFNPIIYMLNIIWFIKICKGAYRVLYPSKINTE
ncbi:TMEM56 [Branchiostoma lanceolatum]|uniref:TMEM56 protein n=1 Tax=Branchiostoma lanceolatum TaxID=7740 RepID=A0A8J9VYH7_BRALA|nr:TMEM56 [Branchiostoma lanceolatum]